LSSLFNNESSILEKFGKPRFPSNVLRRKGGKDVFGYSSEVRYELAFPCIIFEKQRRMPEGQSDGGGQTD
jgi:hypothetical protein